MVVTTRSRGAIANPPPASQAKPVPVKRVGNGGLVGDGNQNDAKASKKLAPKKTAPKKAAPKKAAPKKAAPKKAAPKKPAPKKPAPKKPAPKKPATKKPATKKPVAKKPVAKQLSGKKRSAAELNNDNEASDHEERPAKVVRLESPPAPFRHPSPEPETPALAALAKACRKAFESDYYQPEEVVLYFSDKDERRRYFRDRIIRRGYRHRRCRHKSAAECARKHRGGKGKRAVKETEEPAAVEFGPQLQKVTFENLQALNASTTTNTSNNITLSSTAQSETSAAVSAPARASKKRRRTIAESDDIQPVRKLARLNKASDATVTPNTTTTTTNGKGNMKANPVEISDTSSSGSSSEDETSPPVTGKNPTTGPATQSQTPATGAASATGAEEVINVRARPNIQKPDFTMPASSLGSRMPGFLAQMAAANKELQEQVAAGKKVGIEIDEEDEEEQHIEMNLGLGVLEEKKDGDSSSEEDEDDDGGEDVMQKLRGEKKKEKEVGIQEL